MTRHSLLIMALTAALSGCHPRVAALPGMRPLHCLGGTAVTWQRAARDPRLDQWCAQVGPPLVLAVPERKDAPPITRLTIVSWNVHVGGGRVLDFVESLRRDEGTSAASGLVLLLQETYRQGNDLAPPLPGGGIPNAIRPAKRELDIEALARRLQMSVAYVPSMRNGHSPGIAAEDRGNAVLSTEPLSDVVAIELPYARQRRVAVQATVTPRGAQPLRLLSAHLDTLIVSSGQRRQASALISHLKTVRAGDDLPLVLGIDTNARRGARDLTVRMLAGAVRRLDCSGDSAPLRLFQFDFLFFSRDATAAERCRRDNERYGSDHHPLVLQIATAPSRAISGRP